MKQLLTRCLLLVSLMVMGFATGMAQQSVLNESFASGALPGGWTTIGNDWTFEKNNAEFSALIENAKDTLFAPVVNLSELTNEPTVTMSYSLGAAGANVNSLTLLYRADGQGQWDTLAVFDQATSGETSFVQALPAGMTSVQLAVAADYKAGGSTFVYLLRIANKKEATAAPENFAFENLKTTSVKLTWTASSSDFFERNNLKLSTTPLANPEQDWADVQNYIGETGLANEWCNLTDLQPATTYYAYVQYDCGYGDVSPWAELTFSTPCEAIAAPLYEDFENGLPECYTVYKKGSATTAEVSGEYPYNSTASFKVNIEGTSDFSNYLVLPELEGDLKNYQISFMAASAESGNTYSRRVAVGVCTDATNVAETYSEITTLDLPKGRTWENIVVSFKGYTGAGKYITLKIGHPSMKTNLFIDDIKVEPASACPKPMFVQVSAVTTGAATLSWTKTGSETEWNVVVSTKPLADPEEIEPNTAKGEFADAVSTNPYTLTGLKPNTTYYAYIQAGCGSSEWTEAVTFKTQREVTYPYAEHFDRMDPELYTNNTAAIPNGWVFDDRTTLASDANYYDKQYSSDSYRPYVTTAQNHEATAYVKASLLLRGTGSGTGSTKNISSIAIAPAMPKPVNTMMVTFWAYSSAAQTLKVGVANTQTNDLAQGQQLGANITEVGEAAIAGGSEWKQYKVLLTGYTGTGRYIAFYLKPGTSTPSVYIDDIEIDEAPDCNAVSTLTAEATGIDKATATWTDASSSASWTIKVSSTEIDPSAANGDIVAMQTVNTKTYNISGLAMGGTYYIYVSPSCGDAWMSTTVTTLVGLQVPYYNDFQDENQGSNAARGPKNWTLGNINVTAALGTQTNIPYVYNTAMTGAPADVVKPNLYFYHSNSATNTGAYAIMPELLNANVKDLKMSFYGSYNSTTVTANYSKGMIRVGVVDNPSDINKTNAFTKVTLIKTLYCSAPKITELFTVDFSEYAGSGKYIVFYSDTAKYNYFMLDNLSITLASAPQRITDFVVASKTQTSATFTWTENGNATKWDVRVFAEEQEDPDAGTPVWSEQVSSKTATATGLNHSTLYYAYVRAVQDNGNGDWSKLSFWSETGEWALPYAENFDTYFATSSYRSLPNYYLLTDVNGASIDAGNVYVYINNLGNEGNYLKMQATYTAQYKVTTFAFPPFVKPVNNLEMSFIARSDASSTANESAQQTAIDQSHTEIGVLEEDGTFVPIYDFKVTNALEWEEQYMNFQDYAGAGGRIAIRMDYNKRKATNAIRIKGVQINEIPACGRYAALDFDVDSTSAVISWEKIKTETAWNLKVSSKVLDDPNAEAADVFDGQLTEKSKALTGLEGNTNYYVYIQTVDEANSCVGAWSSALKFTTLCQKQTFPYEEDFQSYETGAGKDLGCMTMCGEDANHSYVASRGATGNKALYLRQVTKDHNNYFVFPTLAVDSVKRLQLNMQVNPGSTTTTNYYYYEVGVMTNPNDPSTFVSIKLDSVQGAAATVFNDKMYTFEGYKGDDKGNFGTYIALKPLHYKNPTSASYSAGYVYIDNVTIDFIETCFKPTDVTGEMGIDTVKLSWKSENEGASYLVRVFGDKDADPETATPVAETTVTAKEAVIRNLTGNTMYYAYVQALCSETDKSKWSSVYQFKTECPLVTALPYVENFDAYGASVVPDCWTSLDGTKVETTSAKAQTTTSKDYYVSGTTAWSIQSTKVGQSQTVTTAAGVTPALDVENMSELLVYFQCRATNNGGALKIEAVSDNTVDADAIVLTQIGNISTSFGYVYLDLAKYYTSVQPYKYLRFTPVVPGNTIYIDDMVFTKDKSVVLPVQDLKLQMITETTAKFSFVEYTPAISEWQVAYVAVGGDIADATIQTISTKEYTLTGLAANTSYDIYVRGNVEGDDWVGPLTATTIQTPAPLPLVTGFEDDANLWNLYNVKTVQGAFYPNFYIVGDASQCGGSGNKALFVTNDSVKYEYNTSTVAVSAAASSLWATRNINIEEPGTYRFRFKVKVPANTENDNDYVTAHLLPAGATFLAANATLLNGTTRIGGATTDVPADNIYSLMGKTLHQDEWVWMSKSLDVEEGGIYSLAIYWYNASVGAKTGQPVAVDSVIVEEYLCTTPKNFEFVEAKATEVTIGWFGGKCKDFEYVVSKYANLGMPNMIDAEDKVSAGTLTDGPQVTITDLLPNTEYSLYVRTICEDGETDWVEYDFETPCALETLPYTESFSETPECWILKSASVGTTQVGTGSSDYEKWNRLQLSNGGIAILPELAVDLKNVEIEIGLFNTTSNLGAVQLGVMDNTWDVSTFEEIAYLQTAFKPASTGSYTPSVLETFHKMMNLYQGTGKVLAIKNATTSSICIKYVKLTELPDCVKPQQVETTLVTDDAVTVNWIAGLEEAWEIKLNDSIIENVTTQPYRVTGLEQGTVYTVAVRALCDAETKSDWSQTTTFQTKCGVNPLPMSEDFSGLPNPPGSNNLARAALTCWDNMVSTLPIEQVAKGNDVLITPASNVYAGNLWVQNWISALGDYAQLHSYHTTSSLQYRYKWFVSPQYAIEGNASLSFEARVCNNAGEAIPDSVSNNDRTFVAVSTDNGATWKMENATNISEQLTGEYKTINIPLDKYAGQNIRVAFYSENVSATSTKYGEQPFVLIDNVRMNCSENVAFTANACEGYDYEGYGFSIKVDDLPLAGKDSTYTRFAQGAGNDCDTLFTLTLTTQPKPESQTLYATICRGEGYPFGDRFITEPNPEGTPYYITAENEFGCSVYTYLYLTVLPADTVPMSSVEVVNNVLPYKVDDNYTIPANALVGTPFDTIVKVGETCTFNKYSVTVTRCQEEVAYTDTLCESADSYLGYGFAIAAADLPAKGTSKDYTRTGEHNATLCDSTVTLTLTVLKNDTTAFEAVLCEKEEAYTENGFELTKADFPAPGSSETYYRRLTNGAGCDSIVILNLEVLKNDTTFFAETLCKDVHAFADYGFSLSADELPAAGEAKTYYRTETALDGCDSITALTIAVLNYDTVAQPAIAVKYAELPYVVNDYYTIPTTALVGTPFEVVVRQGDETVCTFYKYTILVSECNKAADYVATICENQLTYTDYGFSIDKADMPLAGASKQYFRQSKDEQGCDSLISLTLNVLKADTTFVPVAIQNIDLPYTVDEFYTVPADAAVGTPFESTVKTGDCAYHTYQVSITKCEIPVSYEDAICESQDEYNKYGFLIAKADMPAAGASKAYTRHALDEVGCDSVITFTLSVIPNDTTVRTVNIDNTRLPYEVDAYYTVPEDAVIGETFEKVIRLDEDECSYRKYVVTVSQCSMNFNYAESICEDQLGFEGYGFTITEEELPAVGGNKQYFRQNRSEIGCDSLITLTLFRNPNDTTVIPVNINNTQLPYTVDANYTVPVEALTDESFEVVMKIGDNGCAYNRYVVTITVIDCAKDYNYNASVCEGTTSYEGYGFSITADEMPAGGESKYFVRHNPDMLLCDSVITLTLTVTAPDTTLIPVDLCADQTSYEGNGFVIETADMPAAGETKSYYRKEQNPDGCYAVTALALSVMAPDTLTHDSVTVKPKELPYLWEGTEILAADTEPGVYEVVLKLTDDACSYDRFIITVLNPEALIQITDGVERIELFDAFGHKVATLTRDSDLKSLTLPQGVYMIRTTMTSGAAKTGKCVIR